MMLSSVWSGCCVARRSALVRKSLSFGPIWQACRGPLQVRVPWWCVHPTRPQSERGYSTQAAVQQSATERAMEGAAMTP